MNMRAVLVTEGSGGHLIPALEVARELVRGGVQVQLWYVRRRQTAALADALIHAANAAPVDVHVVANRPATHVPARLWSGARLWWRSQWAWGARPPDVVVGFGGWVSVPVALAAKQRRIPLLVHEQNVQLGRANRWLTRWADCVAVSFEETATVCNGTPSVFTGLPTRETIGACSRQEAAERFGFDPGRPTLLVLGGSQGAAAINRLVMCALPDVSAAERACWQVIHLTGVAGEADVQAAYTAHGLRAVVAPWLDDMDAALAHADVVIARAGASTIAELSRCGVPSVLIPYPLADGHQRANARLVQTVGGGIVLEEAEATPKRLLDIVRRVLSDWGLHERLASRIRALAVPDATTRLAQAITDLAHSTQSPHPNPPPPLGERGRVRGYLSAVCCLLSS